MIDSNFPALPKKQCVMRFLRSKTMLRIAICSAAATGMAALVAPGSALAQDIRNGESIAKTWCVGCHLVNGDAPRLGMRDDIPSFAAIAQMNSTTATSLRVFLSTPHANMPDYNLTQREISDVSTYILSLRH